MNDDDLRVRQQRSILLSAFLTMLMGSAAFVLMFLLCGGLSIYILAVIGGLVVFGYVHYFLWGQALSQEVAGEREREAHEGEFEDEDWNWEEPHRRGRL